MERKMDYFIELSYPKNLDPKTKAFFSTKFRRLGNIKIKRGQYLIDRKDILDKIKALSAEFNIGLKITEYKELPPSLKDYSKQIEINEKKKAYYITMKNAFQILYNMFVSIGKNPKKENFIKELGKIDFTIINSALKIVEGKE